MFSSCGELGLSLVAGHGLLIAVFSCGRIQALGTCASVAAVRRSVVVLHKLWFPETREIFLDQGLNSRPLNWQTDSYPLSLRGSPVVELLLKFYELVCESFTTPHNTVISVQLHIK